MIFAAGDAAAGAGALREDERGGEAGGGEGEIAANGPIITPALAEGSLLY